MKVRFELLLIDAAKSVDVRIHHIHLATESDLPFVPAKGMEFDLGEMGGDCDSLRIAAVDVVWIIREQLWEVYFGVINQEYWCDEPEDGPDDFDLEYCRRELTALMQGGFKVVGKVPSPE